MTRSLAATPTHALSIPRVNALRGLLITAIWILTAKLTVQHFDIGTLPMSIIWPANGIAYGFVAVYGLAAVPPLVIAVLIWNVMLQQQALAGALWGTGGFGLAMLLAAWALPKFRTAADDDRSAVRDALQYYGILIGLCVGLDLAPGVAQFAQSPVWASLPFHNLLFVYALSAVFGVLFFTRVTELTVRGIEARLRSEYPLRSSIAPLHKPVVVWLLVWTLFTLVSMVLIQIGSVTYANALRYMSFLLLSIVVFRFSTWFSHVGLLLVGLSQMALEIQMLGQAPGALQHWIDLSVMLCVFGVISLLGIATIAEHRWGQRQLARLAHEDMLTGLLNDRGFVRALETFNPRPSAYLVAVEVMQLSAIEELVGQHDTREVECAVARTLQTLCDGECSLSRLHDGYFALMTPSMTRAQQLAESTWKALDGRRFQFNEHGIWLHIAIGAAPLRPELAADEQLAMLALAAQVAGDRFDHRIHFAREEGTSLIDERRAQRRSISLMETALHSAPWDDALSDDALSDDGSVCGFQLYAQPIVDLHDRGSVSFEILLRWRVDGELQAPGAFLPLAERHSLMPAIDRWVLRHTLRLLGAHPSALARLDKVSINLSGSSLSDEQLLDDLRQAVQSSRIPAHKLCFEITETTAIRRPVQALALLRGLRGMGAAVSLDDFGTGLASFAYLKAFPFDILKIDGLFIKDLVRSLQDQTMVAAICTVARNMGLRTVAEFVEDDATIALLRSYGVDAVQGYGVGRPEPLLSTLVALSGSMSDATRGMAPTPPTAPLGPHPDLAQAPP